MRNTQGIPEGEYICSTCNNLKTVKSFIGMNKPLMVEVVVEMVKEKELMDLAESVEIN